MTTYKIYDTSALLNIDISTLVTEETLVSSFVLQELEEIKTNKQKDEKIQAKARAVARKIAMGNFKIANLKRKDYRHFLKKFDWHVDCIDSKILATAWVLSKKQNIVFYTSDYNQYNNAVSIGIKSIFVDEKTLAQMENEEYTGWIKCYPNEEQMAMLYQDPKINILGAKVNQYCEIFEGRELKDILRWTGSKYVPLTPGSFKSILGEKIQPLNIEQKMLMDLLMNDKITVKMSCSKYGSGKSFLMLSYALRLIKDGKYDKLYYVRNAVGAKNAAQVGYLPGDMRAKLHGFLLPIADCCGGEVEMDRLLDEGIIEPVLLSEIRGRTLNGIIFVDECENLTKNLVQLIIGRIGKNSQLWLAGDIKQLDSRIFEVDNGPKAMLKMLAGNPLFGTVKLLKSERSETSRLADLLD